MYIEYYIADLVIVNYNQCGTIYSEIFILVFNSTVPLHVELATLNNTSAL